MDKNKIRILLGSTLFTESKGGGEIYCEYLMKALQTRGHEVKIISGKDIMSRNINEKHVEYIPELHRIWEIGRRSKGIKRSILLNLHMLQCSFFMCKYFLENKNKYDVIHAHDWITLKAGIIARIFTKKPVINTYHSHPPILSIGEAKSSEYITTVSIETGEWLKKRGIKKLSRIPGAVDSGVFKQLDKEDCKEKIGVSNRTIIYVGRMIKEKNVTTLLFAFKEASKKISDLTLLLVGAGPFENELRRITEEIGLNNVRFEGNIPHKTLPIYYNSADLMVMPSDYEAYALVCLEAISCGVPVVLTSQAKSIIEKFEDGSFEVVNPRSVEEMSNAIIKCLEKTEHSKKLIKKSTQGLKGHTWEDRAKIFEDIYWNSLFNLE